MNIIVLSRELPPVGGGCGNFALNICREFAKSGHQVVVFTMHAPGLPKKEDISKGLTVYRLNVFRRDLSNCGILQMVLYIIQCTILLTKMNMKEIDFLYLQSIVPAGFIGVIIKIIKGIPYFITAHGSDVPGYNMDKFQLIHKLIMPFWKLILRHASALSTPSQFLKDLIQRNQGPREAVVIPYGMDVDKYSFVPNKKEKQILVVSRLEPRKNYDLFLSVVNKIEKKSPRLLSGCKICIAGDGTEKARLMELSTVLKTDTKFYGWLPNESDELQALFEESSIFVYPSRQDNFPVALQEAMTAGLAIITTRGTGCEEVVGNCAVLVVPDSTEDMRAALEHLLESPEEVSRLQRRSVRTVREKYAWQAIVQKYLDFFSKNLQPNRG